ncbi:hypothetical protein Q7P37_006245 [Cladosporium fusiforme]
MPIKTAYKSGSHKTTGNQQRDEESSTNEPAAKRLRISQPEQSNDYSSTVKILVGEKEKPFVAHRDIICDKSKFFRAACSKNWRESQERVVRLPEVDEETFHSYLDWIYRNKIVYMGSEREPATKDFHYIRLYLLGEYLLDVNLRNEIMSSLSRGVSRSMTKPNVEVVEYIWERTAPSSLLRTWMADLTAYNTTSMKSFEASIGEYPEAYVHAVAIALANRNKILHDHLKLYTKIPGQSPQKYQETPSEDDDLGLALSQPFAPASLTETTTPQTSTTTSCLSAPDLTSESARYSIADVCLIKLLFATSAAFRHWKSCTSSPPWFTNLPASFHPKAKKAISSVYCYEVENMITVLVGPQEKGFAIHKSNICDKSAFFEAACAPDRLRENNEKLVRLPNVEPVHFEAYAHWVYTQKLVLDVGDQRACDKESAAKEQDFCFDLYILADMLDDAVLRSKMLSIIIEEIALWSNQAWFPSMETVRHVWERTTAGSDLRCFLVRWLINQRSTAIPAMDLDHQPKEFVRDLLTALLDDPNRVLRRGNELQALMEETLL